MLELFLAFWIIFGYLLPNPEDYQWKLYKEQLIEEVSLLGMM